LMSRSLRGNEPPVCCATFRDVPAQLALSADERTLAVGLTDREAHLWDWQTNTAIGPVLMHPSGIRAMTFSPFGRSLLTVDERGTLRSWNITTGELMLEKNFESTATLAFVKFSRDARYLGLQYNIGTLQVVRLY
jgi:WD40 repeat protein